MGGFGGFPFLRNRGDDCGGFGFGGFGGCGGGCGGGFDGGWGGGCGCGFRDRVKTKYFNIRGCVAERCGGGRGGWWD